MDRATWEARRGLITASRIAKIAVVSRFGGPASAFLEITENQMSEDQTEAQRRGVLLEPAILNWYADQMPRWSLSPGAIVRNEQFPFAAATPDAFARLADAPEMKRVVEAKSAAGPVVEQFGEEGSDQIPAEYLCQTQWQMGIAQLPRADVPVLLSDPFAGFVFRLYAVHFDPDLFAHLVELAAKFHRDHIETGRPPPPDGPEQGEEMLARLFPRAAVEEPVSAPEDIDSFGLQLSAVRQEKETLSARELELKNAIKEFLGDRRAVVGTGWKATWGNVKGSSKTDWEAIARELSAPDELIQRHTSISAGHRMFRPTFKDEIR